MEFTFSERENSERRSSFWRYLPGFPRKSKSKQLKNDGDTTHVPKDRDVTLISANKLYSSFRSLTSKKTPKRSGDQTKDEDEAPDPSRNLPKDAGILFLTTDNQLRWRINEVKEKHVQFAPTPSNKYHTYADSPCTGKENVSPQISTKTLKQRTVYETLFDETASPKTRRSSILKEKRPEKQDTRTETLPRTSTRSALSGRQDVTLPSFNVSAITEDAANSRSYGLRALSQDSVLEKSVRSSGDFNANQTLHSAQFCTGDCDIGIPFVPKIKQLQRPVVAANGKKDSAAAGEEAFSTCYCNFPKPRSSVNRLTIPGKNLANVVGQSNCEGSEMIRRCSSQVDWNSRKFPSGNQHSGPLVNVHTGRDSRYKNGTGCKSKLMNETEPDKFSRHAAVSIENSKLRDVADCITRRTVSETNKVNNFKMPCEIQSDGFQKGQTLRATVRKKPAERRVSYPARVWPDGQKTKNHSDLDARFSFRATSINGTKHAFSSMRLNAAEARKYTAGPTTSSPNHQARFKTVHICGSKKESKYDGMSSMADDECSLNCSCVGCEEVVNRRPEKLPLTRKGSVKAKLFFPNEQGLGESAAHAALPSMPEETGCYPISENHWYECGDSMCQSSPQNANVLSQKNAQDKKKSGAGEDVLIAEDYDVIPKDDSEPEHKAVRDSDIFSSTEPLCSEENENTTNQNKSHAEVTPRRSFPDMTPRTKKISESCVSVLQETLKNFLDDTGSKPTVTISGFDSSGMADKPNTIVIQIQNSTGGTSSSKDLCERNVSSKELQSEVERRALSRSLSLPQSLENCGGDKGENCLLIPLNSDDPKRKPLCVPDADDTIAYSRNVSETWDKILDTASNSGYSTVSSMQSISEKDNTAARDEEIIQELIRLGKGLPPSKHVKRASFPTGSPKKHKFKAKDVLSGRAKLKLNIYQNSGMVTVHVVKAVKLSSVRTMNLNPYVKVSLYPDESRRAHWRTAVVHNDNNPVFDQKFSFEALPEDAKKRLIFSIWHRDKEKKRSEFLGCMSFGVYHVLDSNQSLSGWYRLLKEAVGTRKHFAAGSGNALSRLLAH